ncbi:hypothetical protein RSW49_21060, partial [Escherichia coli]|nr:hypothetical protein [Escherichia coli]
DRNRSHWSTSKTPSYTKSVSWQHHPYKLHLPGETSAKYLKIIAFFSGFDLLIFTFQHHFINIPLVFFFSVMIIAITAIYFSLHRLTQKNV